MSSGTKAVSQKAHSPETQIDEPQIRERAHAEIATYGLQEASRRTGMRPDALARLASGAGVYRVTLVTAAHQFGLLTRSAAPLALSTAPTAGELTS